MNDRGNSKIFCLFLSHPKDKDKDKDRQTQPRKEAIAMGFHQQLRLTGPTLRQKIAAVLVISLLVVSGEQLGKVAPGKAWSLRNSPATVPAGKLQPTRRSPAFAAYSTSKRRVPDVSDPLHNR